MHELWNLVNVVHNGAMKGFQPTGIKRWWSTTFAIVEFWSIFALFISLSGAEEFQFQRLSCQTHQEFSDAFSWSISHAEDQLSSSSGHPQTRWPTVNNWVILHCAHLRLLDCSSQLLTPLHQREYVLPIVSPAHVWLPWYHYQQHSKHNFMRAKIDMSYAFQWHFLKLMF